ncbi:MAG: hypothetical protein KAR54_01325 [Candidatus Pacebacteria bacterium]|nr:hypothetical protein [Candidatus Paceibacterota bacterium]
MKKFILFYIFLSWVTIGYSSDISNVRSGCNPESYDTCVVVIFVSNYTKKAIDICFFAKTSICETIMPNISKEDPEPTRFDIIFNRKEIEVVFKGSSGGSVDKSLGFIKKGYIKIKIHPDEDDIFWPIISYRLPFLKKRVIHKFSSS